MGDATADALPQETTLHLLDFLDAVSLSQCAQTFTTWRRLAATDLLWFRLCKSEFGIDGGKADYTSRWQQEKQRAMANLKLYVDFLDEIFFSLAGFFALVAVFAVFPTLLVLKLDGWLMISWTQVFGSIYGLGFIAVMFLLTRLSLVVSVFAPSSTLTKCISYCGATQVAKKIIYNRDVVRKVAALFGASMVLSVVPFAIQLFVDGYIETPRAAALLVWSTTGYATHCVRHLATAKRPPNLDLIVTSSFAASTLLLIRVTFVGTLPWTAVACPYAVLVWSTLKQTSFPNVMTKRYHGRLVASTFSLRRFEGISLSSYYQQHPPLVALALVALKLDSLLFAPWMVIALDYAMWVIAGPLVVFARQFVQVMFREMPIPANLRKL